MNTLTNFRMNALANNVVVNAQEYKLINLYQLISLSLIVISDSLLDSKLSKNGCNFIKNTVVMKVCASYHSTNRLYCKKLHSLYRNR